MKLKSCFIIIIILRTFIHIQSFILLLKKYFDHNFLDSIFFYRKEVCLFSFFWKAVNFDLVLDKHNIDSAMAGSWNQYISRPGEEIFVEVKVKMSV